MEIREWKLIKHTTDDFKNSTIGSEGALKQKKKRLVLKRAVKKLRPMFFSIQQRQRKTYA